MSAPERARRVPETPGQPVTLRHASWQVPSFSCLELGPRTSDACCLVPVLDEDGRIRRQLERMCEPARGIDVVLADGGSTDGSVAPDALRGSVVRALLTKTGPGALSAQMRMGMAWALEQGYEHVVLIDGNDKDDPESLPRFVEALRGGADHVQGSRWVPGGRAIRTPPLRWLAVRLVHAPMISLASRRWSTDTTNGFRGYSARFLLDERVQPFRDVFSGYELHYYLAIRAARLGFATRELPVTRAYPLGAAPTKIRRLGGHLSILGALFSACLGRWDP